MLNRVVLNLDLVKFVGDFAANQHANWVFEKQGSGWVYGPTHSEERKRHPNLRPYEALDDEVGEISSPDLGFLGFFSAYLCIYVGER